MSEKEERAHGLWLIGFADNDGINWKCKCSKCGQTENNAKHVVLNYNFCPFCGAKMDEPNYWKIAFKDWEDI